MSTVFAYYGSKNSIADQIVALMPQHRGYVEPFAGSLAVLRAKPPAAFECVNDLDGDLMTFWRVLRDQLEDLERLAALTPHSRAEYEASWPIDTSDDLRRAWRVWVKLSQGRGGQLRTTGWRYHETTRGRGSGMPVTLAGYVHRGPLVERRAAHRCRPRSRRPGVTAPKRPAEQPRRRQLHRRPQVEALARAIDKTGPIDTLGHFLAQAARENA